jgi:hypothetical protein
MCCLGIQLINSLFVAITTPRPGCFECNFVMVRRWGSGVQWLRRSPTAALVGCMVECSSRKYLTSDFGTLTKAYHTYLPDADNMPSTQARETTIFQLATEAASYIQSVVPEGLRAPRVGIICGSGLGGLVNTLEVAPQIAIPYSNIPEFPQSTGSSPSNFYYASAERLSSCGTCGQACFRMPRREEDTRGGDGWPCTVCIARFHPKLQS